MRAGAVSERSWTLLSAAWIGDISADSSRRSEDSTLLTVCSRTKRPRVGSVVKYRNPWTVPSFLPWRDPTSKPTQCPVAKAVRPTYLTTPTSPEPWIFTMSPHRGAHRWWCGSSTRAPAALSSKSSGNTRTSAGEDAELRSHGESRTVSRMALKVARGGARDMSGVCSIGTLKQRAREAKDGRATQMLRNEPSTTDIVFGICTTIICRTLPCLNIGVHYEYLRHVLTLIQLRWDEYQIGPSRSGHLNFSSVPHSPPPAQKARRLSSCAASSSSVGCLQLGRASQGIGSRRGEVAAVLVEDSRRFYGGQDAFPRERGLLVALRGRGRRSGCLERRRGPHHNASVRGLCGGHRAVLHVQQSGVSHAEAEGYAAPQEDALRCGEQNVS
eukprot:scaffold2325_cov257-Pinguiococcus_pyrenoidosus.AAC.13